MKSTDHIIAVLHKFILALVILYFCNSCPCLYALVGGINLFIYLSLIYLGYTYQLLERVSTWKRGRLLICAHFTVFSFVMANNNKKFGAIFGCNITFCV